MKSFQPASFPFPTRFPFAKPDLTEAWFALPSLDIEALGEAHRKNAAAVTSANQAVFDGLNSLAQRQADLFKTAIDDYSKLGSDVLASGSFDDRVTKQADAARQIYHSTVVRFRELSDIAVKANIAATDILNARVTEAFDEFRALFAAPVPLYRDRRSAGLGHHRPWRWRRRSRHRPAGGRRGRAHAHRHCCADDQARKGSTRRQGRPTSDDSDLTTIARRSGLSADKERVNRRSEHAPREKFVNCRSAYQSRFRVMGGC